MNSDKIALVVPSIRAEQIEKFINGWDLATRSAGVHTIVVEDNPERSFELPDHVTHYSWAEIDADLGENAWIIPRRTDCIRSYGYLKAVESGADYIVTIDDDCWPVTPHSFFENHVAWLNARGMTNAWDTVIDDGVQRGMPVDRKRSWDIAINVGLWQGVPDLAADYSLRAGNYLYDITPHFVPPPGIYTPMCGMNLSFHRACLPFMYFLLMGKDYPFDRFGDIWCGLFAKRICDHLRLAMHFGEPFVRHEQASNVFNNLIKEAPGIKAHEILWRCVDGFTLSGRTIGECYLELADMVFEDASVDVLDYPDDNAYWCNLSAAMHIWTELADAALHKGGTWKNAAS